ncbi:hypothetical protein NEUTE1DRAFT_119886 [Neurospora tetrasperma FGSC 2508]|uniref:Uncharacterized protein n=1 Tax=Neurospora tetrasperma (strain FGSC 2508 / ATCC MYA-4615 / P0657) TaxID=510951 RepID=F8ME84_NEUT8|nr:uncharacterized protein NEUTE1DRAFT_119886 [Neurospora tetrasperma FGSC 2508]EGO60768.1 hypothetical protein NEUTE1DRAFT_119886 [Neurospora tetrasperma FGSC 2508]
MADSTSWLRRFQQSRAQPAKQQLQPVITSTSEDSSVTSVTTIDGNENALPLSHPASTSKHHNNDGGIHVVSNAGSGSGSGGTAFGGNTSGSGPLPPKTPTAGVFSSGASTASLRRPSLPHQKSPSDSNVIGTSSRLLRSRPSATFQRVSSLLNLGASGNGADSPSATAPSSPSFSPGRPREGSGGSTSRFTFFRPLTPSAAAAPAPSLSALPLRNWSATNGDDEDDWLGGLRRNAARGSPWHNPNLMQMAETLQAVMMTKGDSMAPLPVQYNSLVHNVLEGFAHLTKRLQALEQELAELKNLREKELEQFRGISEEWIQRENGYKAEIKRLEVVLAKESKDGLASVTLARQDTLIDRSGSKRFQAKLKRMSTTANRDRAGESDDDGDKVVDERFGGEKTRDRTQSGIRESSLRILPVDNDARISQMVKKRAMEDKRWRRSQLQPSMDTPPTCVEETLVDSSSPTSPSPTKPHSGPRSSQNQHVVSVNGQLYSPSTSSSSTASTASREASRSLSQRRNINNLVIETGDVSTAVNPRQRRIFSYIEGEAEVLGTASAASEQPPAGTNGIDLPDRNSTSTVHPTAEGSMANLSSTRPTEEDSTTTFTSTSLGSSNLTGLTPSNSTGSVIWLGKRNSRTAATATAAATSSAVQVDQPSHYETSVGGEDIGSGNYELGEMTSTTYHQYNSTMTTTTSPRLGPGFGSGPAIPPRTTSHQQQHMVGNVSPIKDKFEQLLQQQQQQQQKQSQPGSGKSPARVVEKRDKDTTKSRMNKNHVSATVPKFTEWTHGDLR